MIDGRLLIEKLLNYGTACLELADYDVAVKRNLLRHVFRLFDGEIPQFKGSINLNPLKDDVSRYACENNLVGEGDEVGFVNFVLGLLLPLPSVVNKKFRTMREQFGASAACGYLRSLSVCASCIDDYDCKNGLDRYCSDNGVEVLIPNENHRSYSVKGDGCCLCAESEGAFDTKGLCGSLRNVSLILNSRPWHMHYVNSLSRSEECLISSDDHSFNDVTESTIVSMLDFVEYIPDYSITVTNDLDKRGVYSKEHDHFVAGRFSPALFEAKPTFSGVCTVYPDVEVSVYNNSISSIRLQSFNRNTLERLAVDVVEAWASYKDDSMGIFGMGADGNSRNKVTLCARYGADNRYCIDLILTCDKASYAYSEGDFTVFDSFADFGSLFGRFVVDGSFKKVLEMIFAVLTKKIPMDDSLFTEGNVLFGYKATVEAIIHDNGYFRDAQRAEPSVKKALCDGFTDALLKMAAFFPGDDGNRAFKKFLAEVNVR